MNNFKLKTLLLISIIVFLVATCRTEASIIINELQISPTDNRFIELYNTSNNEVGLTGYYLQRKTATGDKFSSFVSSTNLEGKVIKANSYFLISKHSIGNADLVIDNLTITESNVIQLKNNKQEVIYKIGIGEVSDCGNICVSSPAENKSIQRVSEDNWVVATPTPGFKNGGGDGGNEELGDNNIMTSYLDDSEKNEEKIETKKVILNSKITTKILAPKTVIAGVPFMINHQTIGYKNEPKIFDRFSWNFGDGNAKEMEPCLPFNYTYFYPGDYVLNLSYYDTDFSVIPEATDRLNIKVVPSGINILSVGDEIDPYVEIENNSIHEMVLNKWSIIGVNHFFVIPDGTTILPNKKIKFSSRITGFYYEDLGSLKITDDKGTIFAIYPKPKTVPLVKVAPKTKTNKPNLLNLKNQKKDAEEDLKEIVNLNNLQASAYGHVKDNNSKIIYFGLTLIIVLGITVVLILRKGKNDPNQLEKELNADDFKIIE